MRLFLFFVLFATALVAKDIKPDYKLKASGGVTDMVIANDKLYAGTDASCVDIFDIKSKKKINSIVISKIKDFMGDEIDSKIYSIDVLDGAVLILSQDNGGYRRVDIYKDGKLSHVVTKSERMYISKAKFIDKNTILLGLLSNVVISYEIATKKHKWEVQPTESKFSNFVLNSEKTKAISTDESGDLRMLKLDDGSIVKTFSGQNVDNVFQVDWKNSTIVTAGQDRRCVVFDEKTKGGYYKDATFLIYSVGLREDSVLAAYASDELNNVTLFNTKTKQVKAKLVGNKSNISSIVLYKNNQVFVACDGDEINHYSY